jgi:hypothetical protein
MHTLSRTRQTKHSVETIWETLASFNKIEDWHPRVDRSPGTSREDFGIGASRVCYFIDGTSVNETVTAYEAGKYVDIELTEMSMPLKSMAGRFSIIPGLGGSALTMTMNFQPKYGPLGALMATFMMKPMLSKMMDQVLANLDDHLAQGTSTARAA